MFRKTTRLLATSAVLAALGSALIVSPATAADIYDRGRVTSYEDPRYADIYTHPEPSRPLGPPRREYLAPMPPQYFDGHRFDGPRLDGSRLDGPRRHSSAPNGNCAAHNEIRRDLTEQGWSEFTDVELRGATALIEARRPNGNLYQLKIDRCSGEILNAQRLGDQRRPYAWREREGGRTY
jgi:hypothetical protein